METRHILAIVGVLAVFGWQNRVKLKSLASAAIAKSTPVLGNSKTAWAAAVLAFLTAFWPDIAAKLPDIRNANEIRSLQETIVTLDEQKKELAERNQWQAEQIEKMMPEARDIVDRAFESQEKAFRKLQSDKAARLRAGEFASESESVKWFESQYIDAKKTALKELLEYEYDHFGMEKWSPAAEADIAEKLAVQGGVK